MQCRKFYNRQNAGLKQHILKSQNENYKSITVQMSHNKEYYICKSMKKYSSFVKEAKNYTIQFERLLNM